MTPEQSTTLITLDQAAVDAAISDLKSNVKDSVLYAAKTALTVQLSDVQDVDAYKKAVKDSKNYKKLRVAVEKRRKEIIAPALEFQKAINAEGKEIIETLKAAEDHLSDQIKLIDDEVARQREINRQKRVKALTEAGFTFDGYNYVAGPVVISAHNLTEIEVDLLKQDIDKGKEYVAAEIKRKQEEEEQRRKEDEARRAEQEALERQRAELAKAQAEMNEKLAQLERMKAEAAEIEARKAQPKAAVRPTPEPSKAEPKIPPYQGGPLHNPGPVTKQVAPDPEIEQAVAKTTTNAQPSSEYEQGFFDAKKQLLEAFNSGEKRSRQQWIDFIWEMQPKTN